MFVWVSLQPFLAISDFFDSYHAIATLCNLKNIGNLEFLAISLSKMVEIAHFGGHFLGQKIAFLAFLVTLELFWTILERRIAIFRFFRSPKT